MSTAQTTPEATTAETTFKQKYNDVLSTQDVGSAPRIVGEAVLEITDSKKVPVSFSKLTKEIAEAAGRNDVDTVLKLSQDLKNVKDNEGQNKKALQELHTKFKFHDVVQAFHAEFEELAYQIAHKVLTETHVQLVKATKKTRSTGSTAADGEGSTAGSTRGKNKASAYILTKPDGTEITFPIKMGPKGNIDFKAAEDAYVAMGFELIQDPESKEWAIEPGTIEMNNGSAEEPTNRVNLIKAIEGKTAKNFEGWTVKQIKLD